MKLATFIEGQQAMMATVSTLTDMFDVIVSHLENINMDEELSPPNSSREAHSVTHRSHKIKGKSRSCYGASYYFLECMWHKGQGKPCSSEGTCLPAQSNSYSFRKLLLVLYLVTGRPPHSLSVFLTSTQSKTVSSCMCTLQSHASFSVPLLMQT